MVETGGAGDERGPRGGFTPAAIQRIENGLIAALAFTAGVVLAPPLWWFPLAVFLVFDLSMVGYVRSPSAGAFWYNLAHTYAWPAVLAVVALVTAASSPSLSRWLALIAFAWAFHIGVDRALGYGLKLPDAFTHTHLGWIGRDRPRRVP